MVSVRLTRYSTLLLYSLTSHLFFQTFHIVGCCIGIAYTLLDESINTQFILLF